MGCSADSRRITQARNHRFGTQRLAVSARPSHQTVKTWRTFLTNHLGQFTFILPETSPHASSADGFIGPTCRPTVLSRAVLGVPHERAVVDWRASLHRTSPSKHIVQPDVRDRTAIQHRGGRGPPAQRGLRQTTVYARRVDWPSSIGSLRRTTYRTISRGPTLALVVTVVGRQGVFVRVRRLVLVLTAVGLLARHRWPKSRRRAAKPRPRIVKGRLPDPSRMNCAPLDCDFWMGAMLLTERIPADEIRHAVEVIENSARARSAN